MYFLLNVLSPIVKNFYFMDGKAEKENCALANKRDDIWFENKRKETAK
jgi:hypothetical protein